jgi:hypothetical protein
MLVILKIPVVYLCSVVWYAVRAKPLPLEPALKPAAADPDPRPGWSYSRSPRRPRRGPHGSPGRGYVRVARARATT